MNIYGHHYLYHCILCTSKLSHYVSFEAIFNFCNLQYRLKFAIKNLINRESASTATRKDMASGGIIVGKCSVPGRSRRQHKSTFLLLLEHSMVLLSAFEFGLITPEIEKFSSAVCTQI